jgi:hypothetical protein
MNTGDPITGTVTLALDNLSPNIRLYNQTGVTQNTSPSGSPYVDTKYLVTPPMQGRCIGAFSNPHSAAAL